MLQYFNPALNGSDHINHIYYEKYCSTFVKIFEFI